jgi:cytochrome P450
VMQSANFADRPAYDIVHFLREQMRVSLGIAFSNGNYWRTHRRYANHTLLAPAVVRGFHRPVHRLADQLVESWRPHADSGRAFAVNPGLSAFTLDAIGRLAFGADFGALRGQHSALSAAIADVSSYIQTFLSAPLPYYKYVSTPMVRRLKHSCRVMNETGRRYLDEKRERMRRQGNAGYVDAMRQADAVDAGSQVDLVDAARGATDDEAAHTVDFVQLMLSQQAESPDSLSDAHILGDLLDVIGAGQETTATLLTFAVHVLATEPGVQERAYQELLDAAQGSAERVRLSAEPLLELTPYLDNVLRETLRRYPPVALFSQATIDADELGGYRIPPHTGIAICPYLLAHDPHLWPDPFRFDPDRHRPEARLVQRQRQAKAGVGGEGKSARFAYLPFGAGRRSCVGARIALLEAKLALLRILAHYHIRPTRQYRAPELTQNFTSVPDGEVRVHLSLR